MSNILNPALQQPSEFAELAPVTAPPSLLAWVPYTPGSPETMLRLIDRLIGNYLKDRLYLDSSYLHQAGESWKRKINQFYPTGLTHCLIMSVSKDQTSVIPYRFRCKTAGIHSHSDGWNKLIKNIEHELIYRVVQLSSNNAELYEIKRSKATLQIRLEMNRHDRVKSIVEFARSVKQIQKDQQGPLMVRSSGSGMEELDMLILSNHTSIHQYFLNQKRIPIDEWRAHIEKSELPQKWISDWNELRIDQAKQQNKWTTCELLITKYIRQNRISSIVLNETGINTFDNNDECNSLLFENNINILFNDRIQLGAILK